MRLIVTRHAKSSWDYVNLADHDRPLSKRGRRSSDAIGRWLAEKGYIPKIVFCSSSRRTCETWERIEKFMPGECDFHLEKDLYHASSDSIAEIIASADESPVMVLGHNPGIGWFAETVVRDSPQHPGFMHYPTAATLVCDLPIDNWHDIEPHSAEVVDFVVPRQLV